MIPANDAARDAFAQVAQKALDDKGWSPSARQHIQSNHQPIQVSTCSNASESDGGTGPAKTLRPVLKGCYILDLAVPPSEPHKGWFIGGGKFSECEIPPDILLTERTKQHSVSHNHARLFHNFASGALIISKIDSDKILVNGHELLERQRVIHGRTTSLEFGNLRYTLEVRKYNADDHYRYLLKCYKGKHDIADDDYPQNMVATPSESDLVTENYVLKNPVGDGATSVVYAAHERINGKAVAVKKIRRSENNAKAIERDIQITQYIGEHVSRPIVARRPFANCRQPRICNLIDVIDPAAEDPNRGYVMLGLDEIFLVYTPLASWTIQDFIDNDLLLKETTREEIFWQLLEGIDFLHTLGVMHRDIKPTNMAVVSINPSHPQARLIDFGVAIKSLRSFDYKPGTLPYQAPEVLAGLDKRVKLAFTEKVDIFSFGLSMSQLFCGIQCAWDRIDQDAEGKISTLLLNEISRRLFKSTKCGRLMQLISLFIEWDPQDRPGAAEALDLGGRTDQSRLELVKKSQAHHEVEEHGVAGEGSSKGEVRVSEPGVRIQKLSSTAKTFHPRQG